MRQNDTSKFIWDIVILLIAIFNCITIPLSLSFDQIAASFETNTYYNFINISSTLFFIADIFLNFNTTYYDQDGEEVLDKKRIRIHYIFTSFLVDLASSLPIDIFFPGSPLRILNILKIIRVFRLTGIINKMNADEETKSIIRMFQLVFQLLLMMHMVANFWYFLCK